VPRTSETPTPSIEQFPLSPHKAADAQCAEISAACRSARIMSAILLHGTIVAVDKPDQFAIVRRHAQPHWKDGSVYPTVITGRRLAGEVTESVGVVRIGRRLRKGNPQRGRQITQATFP
jgi:hypothetical protein